jgi:hypothetical protein
LGTLRENTSGSKGIVTHLTVTLITIGRHTDSLSVSLKTGNDFFLSHKSEKIFRSGNVYGITGVSLVSPFVDTHTVHNDQQKRSFHAGIHCRFPQLKIHSAYLSFL